MSFLDRIVAIFAKEITEKVIERLDSYFSKLSKYREFSTKKDQKGLELKDMIAKAQTTEEREVLLDKLDELLRSDIPFK